MAGMGWGVPLLGKCVAVDAGSPQARSRSLQRSEPPAPGVQAGLSRTRAGAGSMRARLCGEREVFLEAMGRGLLSLESCRGAQDHGLRTDLLHHEIPSPATAGTTSRNLLQKDYRFLAAFRISSSASPGVFRRVQSAPDPWQGPRMAMKKQRWAAGEEGLTPRSLTYFWGREVSSSPLLF